MNYTILLIDGGVVVQLMSKPYSHISFCYLVQTTNNKTLGSFKNSHQLGFVAHHIHLCFQARVSDESLLAPHPRL